MRSLITNAEHDEIISAGGIARRAGKSADACPYSNADMQERHLWLAGYWDADVDIERGR